MEIGEIVMSLYLKQLSSKDGIEVFNMLKGIQPVENSFTNPVHNMDFDEYRNWLVQQEDWSNEKNLPEGYVGQTIFWLMDDDTVVGIGKIRHSLTPASRQNGGNIGYAINSKYRGKGYGNEILRLLLEKAKAMKIKEIMLTVDKYNYASKSVIEKNGGILFDENDERWYFKF